MTNHSQFPGPVIGGPYHGEVVSQQSKYFQCVEWPKTNYFQLDLAIPDGAVLRRHEYRFINGFWFHESVEVKFNEQIIKDRP